jgi:hypothetical protein
MAMDMHATMLRLYNEDQQGKLVSCEPVAIQKDVSMKAEEYPMLGAAT